tara:strand:- start:1030 stop:1962 length:933 start_codon:yes stop_codon:yes gene_type:complete
MIFNKPNYWNTRISVLSIILLPLTLIVFTITFLKQNITKSKKYEIPILCIGNIYIGGTGKTPTSIFIAKKLKESGHNPAILRKFYKSHSDEHGLIRNKFNNLILSKNRKDGILKSQNANFDSVILDDGFQDYSIKKDLIVLCFNQKQLIGNGMILPSGPLREGLNSLKRADIILINGKKDVKFENKILKINENLEIFYSNYIPVNLDEFRNKKLIAVAGIGNPENFFITLEENNIKIEKKKIFPDHYKFSRNEIQNLINEADKLNCQIIMTEKDYFKIKDYNISKIKYLKVSLEIDNSDKFLNKIKKIYD